MFVFAKFIDGNTIYYIYFSSLQAFSLILSFIICYQSVNDRFTIYHLFDHKIVIIYG